MTLEEIINNSESGPIFNNAAQIWNHTFYFEAL
jgi:Fe-Mn family superoxide dismutase